MVGSGAFTKEVHVLIKNSIEGLSKIRENGLAYRAMGSEFENATDKIVAQSIKQRDAITALSRKNKFLIEQSRRMGMSMRRVTQAMSEQGLVFSKSGGVVDLVGRKVDNLNQRMDAGINNTKKFQMNWLSIMFFGMAIQRMFSGLIRTSLEWTGVTEIMSTALGILFLPVALMLLDWAIAFLNIIQELSPSQKKWIGIITLATIALGGLLMIVGQVALGLGGIKWLFAAKGIGSLGTAAGVASGKVGGLSSKLGMISKFVAPAIFFGLAIKDAAEGQLTAALGDILIGLGFIMGGGFGVAVGILGLTLKLTGDDDFLGSLIKLLFKAADIVALFGEGIVNFFKTLVTEGKFSVGQGTNDLAISKLSEIMSEGGFQSKLLQSITKGAGLRTYSGEELIPNFPTPGTNSSSGAPNVGSPVFNQTINITGNNDEIQRAIREDKLETMRMFERLTQSR